MDGEALNAHFENVKRKRDAKYGGGGNGPIEDPRENLLAAEMLAAA